MHFEGDKISDASRSCIRRQPGGRSPSIKTLRQSTEPEALFRQIVSVFLPDCHGRHACAESFTEFYFRAAGRGLRQHEARPVTAIDREQVGP